MEIVEALRCSRWELRSSGTSVENGAEGGLVMGHSLGCSTESGGVSGGRFQHVFDGFLGDDEPFAEAKGRELADACHFIGQGTADTQELTGFFDCESEFFCCHSVSSPLDK